MMRMIAGPGDPTEGDILIDGRRGNDLEPKVRNVAMMFHSYALHFSMNDCENIRFRLKVRRTDPAATTRRATPAMGELDEFPAPQTGRASGWPATPVALRPRHRAGARMSSLTDGAAVEPRREAAGL
ncbi:MAG: hypothetical protein R3D80_20850 [Paracoccaceae bacterium]